MKSQIIQAKLSIPQNHPSLVSRQRLSEQIEAGVRAGSKLTLVAAPAGFGKSTAASIWILNNQRQVAWLSLDNSDNDPLLFWTYVITSIQTVFPHFAETLISKLAASPLPSLQSVLATLMNDLRDLQEPIILVLDDYHVIENQEIHDSIKFFLEHQPQQVHLVIATRADPPLPIARLRAQRSLTELRAKDLRFTLDETITLLNGVMGLELATEDIELLETRTEGWGVGLLLAAQSMQGIADKSKFISDLSGSHQYILEYLIEEVLNSLPGDIQRFLLQTSILDRMCGALCNALTGEMNGEDVIQQLRMDNLFIVSLDQDQQWFRYHHLFADLLGKFLTKEYSNSEILGLYLRASQFYQDEGNIESAIKYALRGQDFERAASLIEQIVDQLIAHGRLRTLLEWIKSIPEAVIHAHPRLRIHYAWTLSLSGQHKKAEQILLDTKSTLESLPHSPENLAVRGELAALLTGIITYYNDPPRIIQEAQEALTYLPKDNLISRARVLIALGTAYAYSDDMMRAIEKCQDARDMALKAGNPFLAAAAIEMVAGMQINHLGSLREAARNLEQILELGKTTKDGIYQPFTGTAHILLAEINIEWNNLDAASKLLETGVRLLQQGGISYSLTYTHCTEARLKIALGEMENAGEALQLAEQAAKNSPLMHILVHNLVCQVRYELISGNTDRASQWVNTDYSLIKNQIPLGLPPYLREIQQIALARVLLAQREVEKTLETLSDISSQAETTGRIRHLVEIYLLKAVALNQKGKSEDAIEVFEKCLDLAEPERYLRLFLESGESLPELLWMDGLDGKHKKYIGKLMAALSGQRGETTDEALFIKAQGEIIEPLTKRELEVLRLMCEGLSNQDIADQLIVSINTVKKHTSNVYAKLGVRNRAQAVLRAREIELV